MADPTEQDQVMNEATTDNTNEKEIQENENVNQEKIGHFDNKQVKIPQSKEQLEILEQKILNKPLSFQKQKEFLSELGCAYENAKTPEESSFFKGWLLQSLEKMRFTFTLPSDLAKILFNFQLENKAEASFFEDLLKETPSFEIWSLFYNKFVKTMSKDLQMFIIKEFIPTIGHNFQHCSKFFKDVLELLKNESPAKTLEFLEIQIKIPHSDYADTIAIFCQFLEENPDVKPSFDFAVEMEKVESELDILAPHEKLIAEASKIPLSDPKSHEDVIFKWKSYLDAVFLNEKVSALFSNDFKMALLERSILENPLEEKFYEMYFDWANSVFFANLSTIVATDKSAQEKNLDVVISIVEKCVSNCFSKEKFFSRYVQLIMILLEQERMPVFLQRRKKFDVFVDRLLSCKCFKKGIDYLRLFENLFPFFRVSFERGLAQIESIRSKISACADFLTNNFPKNTDLLASFQTHWAELEMCHFGDVENSRKIMMNAITLHPSDSTLWEKYVELERWTQSPDNLRYAYSTGIRYMTTIQKAVEFGTKWLDFEKNLRGNSMINVISAQNAIETRKKEVETTIAEKDKGQDKEVEGGKKGFAPKQQGKKKEFAPKQQKGTKRKNFDENDQAEYEEEGRYPPKTYNKNLPDPKKRRIEGNPDSFNRKKRAQDQYAFEEQYGRIDQNYNNFDKRQQIPSKIPTNEAPQEQGQPQQQQQKNESETVPGEAEEQKKPVSNPELTLFVWNTPFTCQAADLQTFFEKEGCKVKNVRIILGPDARPKGFAFAEMEDSESLTKGLALHGRVLYGRDLRIEKTKSKEEQKELKDKYLVRKMIPPALLKKK